MEIAEGRKGEGKRDRNTARANNCVTRDNNVRRDTAAPGKERRMNHFHEYEQQ